MSTTLSSMSPLAMRPRQAAMALSISVRTLFSLTKSGEIPCIKLGRAVLYRPADLDRWLAERATPRTGGGK